MELEMLVYGKCECFVMQMLNVCVHPVAVLNTAVRRTYGLLMLVEDARCILQSQSHDCLVDSHECLLLFTYPIMLQ